MFGGATNRVAVGTMWTWSAPNSIHSQPTLRCGNVQILREATERITEIVQMQFIWHFEMCCTLHSSGGSFQHSRSLTISQHVPWREADTSHIFREVITSWEYRVIIYLLFINSGKNRSLNVSKIYLVRAVRNGDGTNCMASSKYNIYRVQEQLWMKGKEYILGVTPTAGLKWAIWSNRKQTWFCVKKMNLQLTWKINYST
jgi:hypothetical protein